MKFSLALRACTFVRWQHGWNINLLSNPRSSNKTQLLCDHDSPGKGTPAFHLSKEYGTFRAGEFFVEIFGNRIVAELGAVPLDAILGFVQ